MQRIKIIQRGWETYTGRLGLAEFDNGVSTVPVSQRVSDAISAFIQIAAVDDSGEVGQMLGIAERMVTQGVVHAEVAKELDTQTDKERVAEDNLVKLRSAPEAELDLHTMESLEDIASKDGLSGLRKIGDLWSVKDRSIPALINKILTAQSEYLAQRKKAEADVAGEPQNEALAGATPSVIGEIPGEGA